MKFTLLLISSLICLTFSLRQLEAYHLLKEVKFDLDEDKEIPNNKEIRYIVYGVDCPKGTRYLVRGGYKLKDTAVYLDGIKKEVVDNYPQKAPQCTYREISKGMIILNNKTFNVKDDFKTDYGKLVMFKLKYMPQYKNKGFSFFTIPNEDPREEYYKMARKSIKK